MLASTTITLQPELTGGIGLAANSTALATIAQESDGGAWRSDQQQVESPTSCLYFLVCEASEGPLASLFKAGVADYLPARYQQHTRTWGSFNLSRSALLRAPSMQDVRDLETALRKVFGNPVAESKAKRAGKTLTSEDFIAAGSCRRYPGRRDNGYTEFYTVDCLEKMLAFAEKWVAYREARGAGACLQRGITAADCALAVGDIDRPPLLTKEERRELRAQCDAANRQAFDKLRAQYEAIMALVLDLALAHERDLIWVDLRQWQRSREHRSGAIGAWGLVDLYFNRIGPAPSAVEIGSGLRSAAHLRLEKDFAPIAALVASMDPHDWRSTGGRRSMGACHLQERNNVEAYVLPHRICADKPLLRLESNFTDPFYPLFEEFESLARRVKDRRWDQLDLC